MPLDGIKIDKSFIRDMQTAQSPGECKNINFVKAFATLAQNLQLHLVAEGVETQEQSQLLTTLGYKIGQGFLFSIPLPANEAIGFMLQTSAQSEDKPDVAKAKLIDMAKFSSR